MFAAAAEGCFHAFMLFRALAILEMLSLLLTSFCSVGPLPLSPRFPHPPLSLLPLCIPRLSNGLRRLLVTGSGGAAWLGSVLLFPRVSFQPAWQSQLISLSTAI